MTTASKWVLSAALGVTFASPAFGMRVCIEDRAALAMPAWAGLVRELQALIPSLDLMLDKGGCEGSAEADVRLTVLKQKEGIPADALGLAYTGNGAILPRLEVFVEPVMRMSNSSDWGTVGRALARVAAHELLHYRRQTRQHEAQGLMQAHLTRTELVSEELRPTFLAALHRD